MILHLLLNSRYLQFEYQKEVVTFYLPHQYFGISSILVLEDGIICRFAPRPLSDDECGKSIPENESRRRNVVKIGFDSKVIWQVQDPLLVFKSMDRFAEKHVFLQSREQASFGSIDFRKGVIILDQAGDTDFELDPSNGSIKLVWIGKR